MAGKEKEELDKDDAAVVLETDGTITLDLSDNPDLEKAAKAKAADPEDGQEEGTAEVVVKPEPKKAVPRVRLEQQEAVKSPAVEEAAKALLETQEQARRDVAAAQATANAERQRREAAERLAALRTQEAEDARNSAESTQITLLDNGIEAATREAVSLEAQLATAFEAGDFKGAAALQTKLSKATATLDRLEAQKAEYSSKPKQAPTTEGRVEYQPQTQASALEQYVSNFAPEAQTWLRAHPECIPAQYGGNATANSKMMKGHYEALSQNIAPNTPEYFRVIEESTGHRQPTSKAAEVVEAEVETKPAPKAKPKLQTSAPPSREPPTAHGLSRGQMTVTLTKEQQEMAKISFPQLPIKDAFAQYARNLVELEAEGKLGRTSH